MALLVQDGKLPIDGAIVMVIGMLMDSPFGAGDREYHFGDVDLTVAFVGVVDFVAPRGSLLHQFYAAADRSSLTFPLEVRVILKRSSGAVNNQKSGRPSTG